jgi:hypothetical protein
MRWTPDAEAVVIHGFDGRRRQGFHRVTLKTGAAELLVRIVQGVNFSLGHFDLSSDGSTLYYVQTGGGERPGVAMLVARDLVSGSERMIGPPSAPPGLVAVSPDGNELAMMAGQYIGFGRMLAVLQLEEVSCPI